MITDHEIAELTPQQRVIEHIQLTDAALKHAAEQELQRKTSQAKIASVIPTVLQLLRTTQAVRPDQLDMVQTKLGNHYETLDLLYKVAQFLNDRGSAANGLGKPDASNELTKQAADKQASNDEVEALAFIARLGS